MAVEWNKVTWYSKLLAVIIFVGTFFLGMYFGRVYQAAIDQAAVSPGSVQQSPAPIGEGARCGGFIRNAPTCSAGFHCVLSGIPDTGGTCVRD